MKHRLINILISPWMVALPVSFVAFILHPVWYVYFPIYYASFLLFILLIQGLSEIRKKRKDELRYRLIMLELNSIKSRLNPHFVFNVMSTLSNLVLKDDKTRAYECITLFSGFLRQTFENSGILAIPLKDELLLVEKYIKLQWIRFSGCFDFNIQVDDQVNLSRRIPKALILTFVEIAVKHGIFHKQRDGLLGIKVTVEEKDTVISIENNGADTGQIEKKTDKKLGMALFIMDEYLEILNALNRSKIIYRTETILDKQNAYSGTKVIIRIPESFKLEINSLKA